MTGWARTGDWVKGGAHKIQWFNLNGSTVQDRQCGGGQWERLAYWQSPRLQLQLGSGWQGALHQVPDSRQAEPERPCDICGRLFKFPVLRRKDFMRIKEQQDGPARWILSRVTSEAWSVSSVAGAFGHAFVAVAGRAFWVGSNDFVETLPLSVLQLFLEIYRLNRSRIGVGGSNTTLEDIAGSTIRTLLHGKINPKDRQVASPLVMQGFPMSLGLFKVVLANSVLVYFGLTPLKKIGWFLGTPDSAQVSIFRWCSGSQCCLDSCRLINPVLSWVCFFSTGLF